MLCVTVTGRTEKEATARLVVLVQRLLRSGMFDPADDFVVWQEGMYWIAEVAKKRRGPPTYNMDGCMALCLRLCEEARADAEAGNKFAREWLVGGWVSKAIDADASAIRRSFGNGGGRSEGHGKTATRPGLVRGSVFMAQKDADGAEGLSRPNLFSFEQDDADRGEGTGQKTDTGPGEICKNPGTADG